MAAQMATSLQAELDASVPKIRASVPPDAMKLIDSDNASLRETFSSKPLKVGDTAPDFTLPNAIKEKVTLSGLLKKHKAVIMTWYRGAWCPYCNIALNHLQKMLPEVEKLGAKLVVLTPETPDESLSLKEKKELKFEVLSDDGCEVAKMYGASFMVSDKLKKAIREFGIEFDKINGNSETRKASLPVPATYVIGKDREITYSFFNLDYTKRAEPSEVLAAVKKTVA